jgi:hypothetical protein
MFAAYLWWNVFVCVCVCVASTSTASNEEHRGSSGNSNNGFFKRPAASLKAAATSVFSFLR